MDAALIPIILVLFIGFTSLYFLLRKQNSSSHDETFIELFKSMQSRIDEMNSNFNKTLSDTQQNINSRLFKNSEELNERLDNAAKVIGDVQKNLGEMSEIGRSMRDLQEFLKSPKLRGNIGEQILAESLTQILPKQSFHLQYAFQNGSVVDAAIKTAGGIIPIDSKFPMENFRKMTDADDSKQKEAFQKEFIRDVKKHIDSISKKYIVTEEGTIDYALMYIPSEAVYYEVVNELSLYEYASKKQVLPVSPMTFYAYLRSIMLSFEGAKISAKAREVLSSIRAISREHERLGDDLSTLSRHVQNSYNMMNNVNNDYMKLGQQITTTKTIAVEEKKMVSDDSE